MIEVADKFDLILNPSKYKCIDKNEKVKVRLSKLYKHDEPDEADVIIPAIKLEQILSDLETLKICITRGFAIIFHEDAGTFVDGTPVTIAVFYNGVAFTKT